MAPANKSRLRTGIGFVGVAALIVAGWVAYAWSKREAPGLEIEAGAFLSIIPTTLAAIMLGWGLVLIVGALRRK